MSLEYLLRDEQELLNLYIEEEMNDMRSVFGWDLPPGVTLNDIDKLDEPVVAMTEQEEIASDALAQDDVEHRRNGYGADPFLPDYELHQAWNELQAVPSYVEQMARAFANETGLEIEPVGSPQFCEHQQYRSLCPACSPLA